MQDTYWVSVAAFLLSFISFSPEEPGYPQVGDSRLHHKPHLSWAARYDGPVATSDYASAIVLDTEGNVYVTGWSASYEHGEDYATVKYDTSGSELWVARYNGPTNGNDRGCAIALDFNGNVYVTGQSWGASLDYVTIKYDRDGNEMWVARYDGPANSDDVAIDLAVDEAGNIYVTGSSKGNGTDFDYASIKYGPDGDEMWIARLNGSGNAEDHARELALDRNGNIYVTGDSFGSRGDYDYATVKYDKAGNEAWIALYKGPVDGPHATGNDFARAIVCDPAGNAYVTGYTGEYPHSDYATIKYDPDGNELWVSLYNEGKGASDKAYAIALDKEGNICVTGNTQWLGYDDLTSVMTLKYDPDGNELWEVELNGGENEYHVSAIASDQDRNTYLTGDFWHDKQKQYYYFATKIDKDGNVLWIKTYSEGGDLHDYHARDLAVDEYGNVHVTGYGDWCSFDYVTLRYDKDGNERWVARYEFLYGAGGADSAKDMAADAIGNVYVTGSSSPYAWYDCTDYSTIKYDSDGNELWIATYGQELDPDWASALAIDANANVYVTGNTATIKYDADGDEVWTAVHDGNLSSTAIEVDIAGNVCITGESDSDYATVKYDVHGNELWVARYNGPGNNRDYATDIVLDSDMNIYITGHSVGNGNFDYATIKYDPDGTELWTARYDASGSPDGANDMRLDKDGNIYVTGTSATIKYDPDGNIIWVAPAPGMQLGLDMNGNVYITGRDLVKYDVNGNELWIVEDMPIDAKSTIDAAGNVYVTGEEGDSAFIIKFDTDGHQIWIVRLPSPEYGYSPEAILLDASANVLVAGTEVSGDLEGDCLTFKYSEHPLAKKIPGRQ
jgi:uncharacterized delta-60 repeat protein